MSGSPANRCGLRLSWFLSHPSGLTRNQKPRQACVVRYVPSLPTYGSPSGSFLTLSASHPCSTRRRLALRSLRYGCNPFVRASLHSLHPSPVRTLKAVFPCAKPYKQQVAVEKRDKEKPSDRQKPKKAQQR